jgi:hypothetical protein
MAWEGQSCRLEAQDKEGLILFARSGRLLMEKASRDMTLSLLPESAGVFWIVDQGNAGR